MLRYMFHTIYHTTNIFYYFSIRYYYINLYIYLLRFQITNYWDMLNSYLKILHYMFHKNYHKEDSYY